MTPGTVVGAALVLFGARALAGAAGLVDDGAPDDAAPPGGYERRPAAPGARAERVSAALAIDVAPSVTS